MPVLRSPLAGGDLLTADTDLDYLFLEHIRLDGDSPASLPKYEAPLASSSNGECVSDPSPGRLSSNRRAVEERESSTHAIGVRIHRHGPRREVNDGGDEGLSDANTLKGVYREAISAQAMAVAAQRFSISVYPCFSACSQRTVLGAVSDKDYYYYYFGGEKVENELGITRRPDSDFKRRLIKALTKPVACMRLFGTVAFRPPLMKLRQVHNETKLYPVEVMGKTYLDYYPSTVSQRLHTSSLMRGFLFWLQNTVHEDQFKPWEYLLDSNAHTVLLLNE
ncbi:hypothetical protein BDA96_06G179000 [Sorghum bicolor]|uniref:Uncharacterized protein n=2 Tax=Sorghum bicolor TaxID=4558 RepID=A0A921QS62_SORBI|nr:hypothetical protein BDA96_06G179000 [Sorghum bicolor]KXG26797.1 hypothetical protein SORBI_3006G162600 [Sorghum bicolor]